MKKFLEEDESLPFDALREATEQLAALRNARLAEQVHDLLHTLREVEEFSERLTETQFNDVIREAILACGFEDEVDAWRGMMEHLRTGRCRELSCQHRIQMG